MQAVRKVSQSNEVGASGAVVTVFTLSGDISSLSKTELLDAYHGLDTAVRNLLLDFHQVDYINSSGIATVIQMLLEASKNGRKVGIVGLNAHFTKVFTMVGVAKYAELSPDLAGTLARL